LGRLKVGLSIAQPWAVISLTESISTHTGGGNLKKAPGNSSFSQDEADRSFSRQAKI
jgi:hypothetical protein